MKPTPILRMSLPKMGFDLGVVRRPEITRKASMLEEAGWLSPGQLPKLMPGKRSDFLTKLMQLSYVGMCATGVFILQVP